MVWEVGVSRCKLPYIEEINNKVFLYSTESYIHYTMINHNGKKCIKKNVYICITKSFCYGFLGGAVVKNPCANAGDERDVGSIPGLGRSPGVGNGNPLWYSGLENSTDREAWQDTVYTVSKSQRVQSD